MIRLIDTVRSPRGGFWAILHDDSPDPDNTRPFIVRSSGASKSDHLETVAQVSDLHAAHRLIVQIETE